MRLLLLVVMLIWLEVDTVKTNQEICWPDNYYTLLKPRSGCPDECGVNFQDNGFIFFNTEEQDNRNSASPDLHISGSVSDFAIRIEFCWKNFRTSNGYTWSPGCYCVFSRLCTAPFEEGMSTWYTETTVPSNVWGGALPDGTFENHRITLQYCCRCDGDPNVPIILPREQEFYLMTHFQARNSCQLVEGMDVRPEYIQWHTDNSENNNTFTNPVPTGVSNNPDPFIMFCYYSPTPNTTTTMVFPTNTPYAVGPVQSTVSSATPQSTVATDSTSDNQLIEDVAIPATIVSVTVLLCITVIIVVTIIVVGVVCCVKRTKNSYKDSYHITTRASLSSPLTQPVSQDITFTNNIKMDDNPAYNPLNYDEHQEMGISMEKNPAYVSTEPQPTSN